MQPQESNSIFAAIADIFPVYVNEARLLLDSDEVGDKMLWLAEGLPDVNLYQQFFIDSLVTWHYPNGCDKVRVIVDRLDSLYPDKIYAIVDSDYYTLNGVPESHANIFRTDWHDHEMWLIYNPGCLEQVCVSHKIPADEAPTIMAEACQGICNLSFIKWLHDIRKRLSQDEGLNFGRSPMEELFNKSIDDSLSFMYSRQDNPERKIQITTQEVEAFKNSNRDVDERHLNVGHDLINALAFVIKGRKRQNIKKEDFYNEFASRFTLECFKSTGTYGKIASYFASNGIPSPLKA